MANNYFNIDINKLVTWLVPPRQRFIILVELLKSLASPLSFIYQKFSAYRQDIEYRLTITPQVCYLEKILNDSFDATLRRINISDSLSYQVLLIHTDEAQEPVLTHLENQGEPYESSIPILHDNSAYVNSGNDFYVNTPFELSNADEYKLKTILNTYKLASKRYKILYT